MPLIAAMWAASTMGGMSLVAGAVMTMPIAVLVAWIAARNYDEPARAWLARRLATCRAIEAAPAL